MAEDVPLPRVGDESLVPVDEHDSTDYSRELLLPGSASQLGFRRLMARLRGTRRDRERNPGTPRGLRPKGPV